MKSFDKLMGGNVKNMTRQGTMDNASIEFLLNRVINNMNDTDCINFEIYYMYVMPSQHLLVILYFYNGPRYQKHKKHTS